MSYYRAGQGPYMTKVFVPPTFFAGRKKDENRESARRLHKQLFGFKPVFMSTGKILAKCARRQAEIRK